MATRQNQKEAIKDGRIKRLIKSIIPRRLVGTDSINRDTVQLLVLGLLMYSVLAPTANLAGQIVSYGVAKGLGII